MSRAEIKTTHQLRMERAKQPRQVRYKANDKRLRAIDNFSVVDKTGTDIQRATRLLADLLKHALDQGHSNSIQDLASIVSALALAEIAFPNAEKRAVSHAQDHRDAYTGIPAESVADSPADDELAAPQSTDDFIWRRQLEHLWKKKLTKDEFHRPVVRSIGAPVMSLVEHVRKGLSWDEICRLYPGLEYEEIRAAVSLATECGWVSDDCN